MLRRLVWHRFGLVFGTLLTVAVAGFALLLIHHETVNALYLTVMDMTGAAFTGPGLSGTEEVAQVLLTVDGMAVIPVITAIVVGARLTGRVRRSPRPPGGHVIVVGLGNVGTAVTGQLHDLGFDVVCVDNRPDAPGIGMARQLGLPVVIGDAFSEETLRPAHLDTCLALAGDQPGRGEPGDRADRAVAPRRPAGRAPAHRRRPGRTAGEDDREHHLPERAVPGRPGLRHRDARAPGAAHHPGRPGTCC